MKGRRGYVLLDVGGVLVNVDPAPARPVFARITGLAPEHLDLTLFESGLKARCDQGEVSAEDLPRVWSAIAGARIDASSAREIFHAVLWPRQETIALLPGLAARGPIGLVSNIDEIHYLQTLGFIGDRARFDRTFVSFRMKVVKPDPRFYDLVAKGIECEPRECLFVDDRPENVAAAARRGFATLLYTGAKCLAEAVELFDTHHDAA